MGMRKRFKESPSPSRAHVPSAHLSDVLRCPPSTPESKEKPAETSALPKVNLNGKKKATKLRKNYRSGKGSKNIEIVRRSDLPPKKKMIKGSHRIILKRDSESKLGKTATK